MYIIIDIPNKRTIRCTDQVGVGYKLGIPVNTVRGWFRDGKNWYYDSSNNVYISRPDEHIKSNRKINFKNGK